MGPEPRCQQPDQAHSSHHSREQLRKETVQLKISPSCKVSVGKPCSGGPNPGATCLGTVQELRMSFTFLNS